MNIRKICQYLFFLTIFLPSVIYCGPPFVIAQGSAEVNTAPINPDFLSYVQNREAHLLGQLSYGRGLGLIPSPHNLSHLVGWISFEGPRVLGFPVTYDLRTQGKLPPVRNQGNCGSCWTFGTYGSLESNLMPLEQWDFSENNLKNTHGFDMGPCDGGNADMSTAYLARRDGPISESDDPYNPGSGTSPSGLSPRKHVQEVLIIPDRANASDNDNIKQVVMTYGVLFTTMYWNDANYNLTYAAYYYNGPLPSNHAVAIVGWDDNFDRNKFLSLPPGNGAFIIRNSWGTGFGESGYFYVSYHDAKIGTENYLFNNAEPTSNYNQIYEYDPLGWTSSIGFGSATAWFANIFTADSSDPLGAVSFYTASLNSTYELYIYTNITSTPTSGSLAGSKAGTIASPGYHTIPLDAPVSLTSGQDFSVVVKLTTPNYDFPISVERPWLNYSTQATANAGESYISSNGSDWSDLTSISWCSECNVCVKAFTSPSVPGGIACASAPAVAWNSTDGKLQLAIRAVNNRIWVGTANANGGFNNDWIQLPSGSTSDAPAIAWNPTTNKVQIATKGNATNNVFVASYNADGTGLSSWTMIPANSLSVPAVTWNATTGNLQMAIRGTNNRINAGTVNGDGTGFSGWTQLPTGTTSAAPAIAWNPVTNEVQIATKGNATNNIFVANMNPNGGGLSAWVQLTGTTPVAPAIAWNSAAGKVEIAIKGTYTNKIFKGNYNTNGLGFSLFTQIPGGDSTASPAIAISPAVGTLNVFARDATANLVEYITGY